MIDLEMRDIRRLYDQTLKGRFADTPWRHWRNDRPRRPRNAGGRRPKGGARRAPRRISMAPVGRQAGFWIRLKGALKVFGSAQRAPWLFEGAPSGRPLQFGGGAPRALRRRQWKSWKIFCLIYRAFLYLVSCAHSIFESLHFVWGLTDRKQLWLLSSSRNLNSSSVPGSVE